jgi:hypothetical protein
LLILLADLLSLLPWLQVVALLLGCGMVLQGTLSAEQLTNYIF